MSHPLLGVQLSAAQARQAWAENARKWPDIGPPWRPSPGDIEIYRRFAGRRLSGRVLILGATPELRDLAGEDARTPAKPVVFDMSRTMLEAMSSLTRQSRKHAEEWVIGDWCTASLPLDTFDVIFADMIWWTVSVAVQAVLRDRIARLLQPGGLFVSRIRVRDVRCASEDPAALTARYLDRLSRDGAREQQLRDAWLSCLYDITADATGRRIDRAGVRALIQSMRDRTSNAARRTFLDVSLDRLVGADWTSQTREEIVGPLLERFFLADEDRAGDYESSSYPILALRALPQ